MNLILESVLLWRFSLISATSILCFVFSGLKVLWSGLQERMQKEGNFLLLALQYWSYPWGTFAFRLRPTQNPILFYATKLKQPNRRHIFKIKNKKKRTTSDFREWTSFLVCMYMFLSSHVYIGVFICLTVSCELSELRVNT